MLTFEEAVASSPGLRILSIRVERLPKGDVSVVVLAQLDRAKRMFTVVADSATHALDGIGVLLLDWVGAE